MATTIIIDVEFVSYNFLQLDFPSMQLTVHMFTFNQGSIRGVCAITMRDFNHWRGLLSKVHLRRDVAANKLEELWHT